MEPNVSRRPPPAAVRTGDDASVVDDLTSQRQARALGDPTRYRIFRYVADAEAPVTVAALAARFGLNHNAVRQHLAKLCAAGLLIDDVAPRGGRGRPALHYRVSPQAAGLWGARSPYEQLSTLLLDLLKGDRTPRQVGADAGRRAAVAADRDPDDVVVFEAELARRGFRPRRVERKTDVELVLERCPFEAAAMAAPQVVCEVHLGLAEGIAEAVGGGLEVTGLVPNDADRAGCRVLLKRASAPG